MPQKPNKLLSLWQELKHRRVFRVVTIYAATTYIIIELVNNLIEPLFLPDWTATLIVILLVAGFPVVVILSWIYDVTPEGIIRTEGKDISQKVKDGSGARKRKLRANDIVIGVLLLIVLALVWPKVFSRDEPDRDKTGYRKMVTAVLPFRNMTGDTSLNRWKTAIQDNIIAVLSTSYDLQVKPAEKVNMLLKRQGENDYILNSSSEGNRTAHKLRAEMYVHGSMKQSGTLIRINTQLSITKSGEDVRSFHIDGTKDNILGLIDTLSSMVKNFLVIYQLQKEVPPAFRDLVTIDEYEEYSFFAYGYRAMLNFDYQTASGRFSRVVETDSTLVFPRVLLSLAYAMQGRYDEARKWCMRANEERKDFSTVLEIWYDYVYALLYETPKEVIGSLNQMEDFDNRRPELFYYRGIAYTSLSQYERSITDLETAVSLYDDQEAIKSWSPAYSALGQAYHRTGQVKKEKKLYKKAVKDFPEDLMLTSRQAILALSEANLQEANKYISKYRSLCRENLLSESETIAGVAGIYSSAGIPDEAEKYYREALSLDPGNPEIMNSLAFTLIENDIALDQGIELIDKALDISPGNYLLLHTKGRGLYKKGQYIEAVEILEKSWELKPVYDHSLYLHLEETRQASALIPGSRPPL
ncbi:MAG: tetratricopeptide repeat protein [Bacteroidales bacterium]|nr:tetratricopeptide repeat protein [Bacteroidales bacterium]